MWLRDLRVREKALSPFRLAVVALLLALAGSVCGCALARQEPGVSALPETTARTKETGAGWKAFALPEKDAPGADISGLPRYPGSVRVGYECRKVDELRLVKASYLTSDRLDAVRGFYRGVFRSESWTVANVEFSGGEWSFLAVDDEREADIRISPRGPSVEADVRLSEPLPRKQPEKTLPPEPTTTTSPEPVPTPVPDEDDFGDDGGGDD